MNTHSLSLYYARVAVFIIYFWFGILKVIGLSPASGVVERLFNETVPLMPFSVFIILFGLFECLIGILFLMKGLEKTAFVLLIIHMVTTFGPLFFLPGETWQGFFVPTLEGQYIIKNLVIISTALFIFLNRKSRAV